MTKSEAKMEMKRLWKEKVSKFFAESPYSKEVWSMYGNKLVKKEIFHTRKQFAVVRCSIQQQWQVVHQESGVVAC